MIFKNKQYSCQITFIILKGREHKDLNQEKVDNHYITWNRYKVFFFIFVRHFFPTLHTNNKDQMKSLFKELWRTKKNLSCKTDVGELFATPKKNLFLLWLSFAVNTYRRGVTRIFLNTLLFFGCLRRQAHIYLLYVR